MTKAEPWLDIHGLTLFPKARLPPGFKMPNLTRFDGTGSPTNFLKSYVGAMSPWGVDEPLMAQLFQQYLDGVAAHWFLNLENSKKTSWRNKAAKMVNRPNEEEQLQMIVKNLLPVYQGRMAFQFFPSFKALISTGTLVEDAIKNGDIKKDEGSSSNTSYNPKFGGNRKTNNNDSIPSKPTNLIHNIGTAPAFQFRSQRNFSPLNMTYAQAFSKLKKANLVQPLHPRPPPRNPPPSYNPNQHCEFHQGPGHDIENCTTFKHRIQDLVDGGRLSVGEPSDKFKNTQPSISNNPLPNHKPPVSINTISTTNNQIDPTLLMVRNTPQMYEMPLSRNYVCVVYDHSTQQKVKLVPCKGLDVIFNKDSFSNVCATIGYDGAFCLIDDEEDAFSLLSMAEKNVGAHLSTPSNFQCPIYLDDLSDDEDLHVAHLTRAGRHFKPSYLEDDNPVEALRRKEKDRELVEVNKEEDDAITRMKEVNANVSIWKLLTHSQPHRAAVLRHLNEVSIDASITPDQMLMERIRRTEEDPEEDLEEDEEIEEDPEEELQENDNDSEVNRQGARHGTNWSNEDEVEEEPKTPKDSDPYFRGESWTSNSFKNDEGSRKRSRAKDFDLDFDVLCYRRLVYPEELILFPNYRHVDRYLNLPQFEKFNGLGDPILHLYNFVNTLYPLNVPKVHFPMLFNRSLGGPALSWYYTSGVTSKGSWGEIAQALSDWAFEFRQIDTKKLKLVNMEQSDRESFSHLFSRCSYIRARLRFPITDREFMLILLRKLNDFYYQHMVSIKYVDLSHMERHGYEIDAYRLQERRPKVHPQGERANRRIFTRIDEPLSVVYDRLSKKGILWAKSYVYSLPPHGTDMRQYCSYCHLYGHRTDTCYNLKCAIQDLIDRGIITPSHPQSSVPETSPAQPRASQDDFFLQLLEEGRIKPLPRRAGVDPVGPNLNKYCHYHQLHGHDTNECHALRWCIKRTTGISCPNQKVSINSLSLWTHEDDPTLLIARHYSDYEKDC
uniref:Retrotransposon gag domain-containing protein n=1 Tax=Chenopodium quinoa TaxID=63459 RepID=A0A803MY15_CHEQI